MRQRRLQANAAVLPQSYQLVLVLREGLNLTFDQIGAIMMLPAGAVRGLFAAAKQHLRR